MTKHRYRRASWLGLTLFLIAAYLILLPIPANGAPPRGTATPRISSNDQLPNQVYLPLIGSACPELPEETFSTLTILGKPTDRPAEQHADLNLALRGDVPTIGTLGLVNLFGPTDLKSPQLYRLFADNRTAEFLTLAQVYDWDWDANTRGAPLADPPVTLAGLRVSPGEKIRVPDSGYDIGTASHMPRLGVEADDDNLTASGAFEVLVLYAAPNRLTLKYTREDNVIKGYTLHVEDICVEPRLLALYDQWNRAGRAQLPALHAGQSFGTAQGTSVDVAIRDTGRFLDPRSRKDWWRGR